MMTKFKYILEIDTQKTWVSWGVIFEILGVQKKPRPFATTASSQINKLFAIKFSIYYYMVCIIHVSWIEYKKNKTNRMGGIWSLFTILTKSFYTYSEHSDFHENDILGDILYSRKLSCKILLTLLLFEV